MIGFVGFMLACGLRTVLITVLGFLATLALRRRSAAMRNVVWRVVLVVCLATPIVLAIGPKLSSSVAPTSDVVRSMRRSTVAPAVLTTLRIAKIDSRIYPSLESDSPFDAWTIASLIYGIGTLFMMRRWMKSMQAIVGVSRRARVCDGDQPSSSTVKIAQDPDLTVPVTFGWLRPTILLPWDSFEWPSSRREAALLHEQAHISRGDWVWLTMAQCLQALHWFNPASWIVCEALRSTAEEAADDAVLASGIASSLYASELLNVAETSGAQIVTGLAMARRAGLKSRLHRIMAPDCDRRLPRARFSVTVATILSGLGGALSVSQIAIASAPVNSALGKIGHGLLGHRQEQNLRHLSSGANVSIAFVVGDKPNQQPWSKDGVTVGRSDLDDLTSGMTLWRDMRLHGNRNVAIGVKVTDASSKSATIRSRFNGENVASQFSIADPETDPRWRSLDWIGVAVPAGLTTANLDLGVASGPFQTIGTNRVGYGSLEIVVHDWIASWTAVEDPISHKIHSVAHYDPSHTRATVSVRVPEEYAKSDLRIVAYDSSGKALPGAGYDSEPSGSNGRYYMSADFMTDSPEKIVRASLLARDYEWVSFHDVHLYPASGR